ALPGGYLGAVAAASLRGGRGLPAAARWRLPLAFVVIHHAWAAGFLTSPRRLALEATQALRSA
ncbi:MAG: glycosyltransferase family 2 protein, partial [Egibacteraceae bacterium]